MFHCNGWCFTWTITAQGGTHVCLRKVDAAAIFDSIRYKGVDHFCGAPIVLNMIVNAPNEARTAFDHRVDVMTAAAPPPAAVIAAMERSGFHVTHVYGLTEVYGPVTVCAWHGEWDALDVEDQAALKARQGVAYVTLDGLGVLARGSAEPVPADGATIGEVVMRGNTVMKGYLKNRPATEEAFAGGWFHTGDLGSWDAVGNIQITDRKKDVIISGGENISSPEIEDALYQHPGVLECAVIGIPHEKWGETPCAIVVAREGHEVKEEELLAFCRDKLAHFKCPSRVELVESLPRTVTGKLQKFKLRERYWAGSGRRVN